MPGRKRVDTNGTPLDGPFHPKGPVDVAVLIHFHCKSWKEYLDKRLKGRADTPDQSAIPAAIERAKIGPTDPNTVRYDDSLWLRMMKVCPRYRMFDEDLSASADVSVVGLNMVPVFICARLKRNDEYYIDEWVDYHLALGVVHIFLYDLSGERWMDQWGEEKQTQSGKRVSLIHFGNSSSTIYQECTQHIHARVQETTIATMMPLDIDEFLVLNGKGTLYDMFKPSSMWTSNLVRLACAMMLPILQFGTSGRLTYEALPVTKRFSHRIESIEPLCKPFLMTTSEKLVANFHGKRALLN
jgi:hypothetical protein